MVIQSIFEFTAIILLIVGFANEEKVIEFETKLFRAIRIKTKRKLKKLLTNSK